VANWYAYYRTRLFTARAGTSLAFDGVPNSFRVGYGSINYPYSSSYSTVVSGVRPYSNIKSNFYNWLFSVTPATSTYYYTPLRRALDNVGKYYEKSEPWLEDPTNNSSKEITCRPSFSILMTDGYWTDDSNSQATTSGARTNNDGTNGSSITGSNNQSYLYTAKSRFTDA
jgi:type IV pilus assembly protein PilY1